MIVFVGIFTTKQSENGEEKQAVEKSRSRFGKERTEIVRKNILYNGEPVSKIWVMSDTTYIDMLGII